MNKFFKKSGLVFIIKIFGLGLAFLFQLIITRNISIKSYGEYTLFLTYINILSIFSMLGLDNSLIKEIPLVKRAKGEKILKMCINISLFTTLLICGIFYRFNINILEKNFLIISIIGIFLKVLITLLDSYFQGKGKIVEVNFYSILLNNLLKIILFFLLKQYKLKGLFISYFLSEILCLLFRIFRVRLKSNNKIKILKKEKKELLKYGILFTLITSISILSQNIDKLMLSHYLGSKAVGIYKVNQNYLSLMSIFVTPFIAFWPVISKLYNQGKIKEIERNFSYIVSLILVLVTPTFVFILYNSSKLLSLFGSEYSNYGLVLIILSIGCLIDTSAGPIGAVLSMTKFQNITLYNSIGCLLLNILLNIILVKKFGIIGIAISTTICTILNNIISILFNKILLNNIPYTLNNIGIGIINCCILILFSIIFINKIINENIVLELFIKLVILSLFSVALNLVFYRKIVINILSRSQMWKKIF